MGLERSGIKYASLFVCLVLKPFKAIKNGLLCCMFGEIPENKVQEVSPQYPARKSYFVLSSNKWQEEKREKSINFEEGCTGSKQNKSILYFEGDNH